MKVISAKEFANLQIKVPWAVEGLIPAYGISLIFADPKVGKSIMSVQLAHALSNGVSFLDHHVMPSPQSLPVWRVLYVQADLPAQEWAHQLKTLDRNDGWDTLIVDPGVMQDPKSVERLKEICKPYDFVIFDALLSLFNYPDINSNSVMGHVLRVVRSVFAGPIWLIHHKRKSAAGIPDRTQQSIIGGVALGAGVSALYDLKTRSMTALGRVINSELNLRRSDNGLWIRIAEDEGDDPLF